MWVLYYLFFLALLTGIWFFWRMVLGGRRHRLWVLWIVVVSGIIFWTFPGEGRMKIKGWWEAYVSPMMPQTSAPAPYQTNPQPPAPPAPAPPAVKTPPRPVEPAAQQKPPEEPPRGTTWRPIPPEEKVEGAVRVEQRSESVSVSH